MPKCPITGKRTDIALNTHELAWAAGFFDGEGCSGCYIKTTKTTAGNDSFSIHMMVQLSQKYVTPLRRFKKAVHGLGYIAERSYFGNTKGSNITPGFTFTCNKFEDCQAIMGMLWRFLTPIKREQFKRAIFKYHEALAEQPITKMRLQKHVNFINPPSPALLNAVKNDELTLAEVTEIGRVN